MTCPAVKAYSAFTVRCTRKDGHYPSTPHLSQWIKLSLLQRIATGIDRLRVEWVEI